jgi:hypothetical protein
MTDDTIDDLTDEQVRERYADVTIGELRQMDKAHARRITEVINPKLGANLRDIAASIGTSGPLSRIMADVQAAGAFTRGNQLDAIGKQIAASGFVGAQTRAALGAAQAAIAAGEHRDRSTRLALEVAKAPEVVKVSEVVKVPPRPEVGLLKRLVELQDQGSALQQQQADALQLLVEAQIEEASEASERARRSDRRARAGVVGSVSAAVLAAMALGGDVELDATTAAAVAAGVVLAAAAAGTDWRRPRRWLRARLTRRG